MVEVMMKLSHSNSCWQCSGTWRVELLSSFPSAMGKLPTGQCGTDVSLKAVYGNKGTHSSDLKSKEG